MRCPQVKHGYEANAPRGAMMSVSQFHSIAAASLLQKLAPGTSDWLTGQSRSVSGQDH